MSDRVLASISFGTLSGDSSFPFDCWLFLCLPILGDSSCLFLQIQMLCFASCVCRANFCGRSSVGLSHLVSLIFLSGCFRVALSSICIVSLFVIGLYLLVAPLLASSLLQQVYWSSQLPHCLVCDWGHG